MPVYLYKARDQGDQVISGRMEADTEEDLVRKIRGMNYIITGITQVKEKKTGKPDTAVTRGRVKQKDVLRFITKLANMLQVGISLTGCIHILATETRKANLKKILNAIYTDVSSGTSFSKSLSYYPNVFPDIMIRMVQVGETTGKLSEILSEYAEYAERQADIKGQIKSALMYPMTVICVSGIILYVFLGFIVPRFITVFKSSKTALPLPTQILVNLSDFCRGYWLHTIIGVIVLIIGYKLAKRMKGFVEFIDRIKLKLPGVSTLLKKIIQARFSQTLGLLYQSGVPILESIKTVENIAGNTRYAYAMRGLYEHVKDGKRISDYISGNPLFNSDLVEMVNVGESTGQLSSMLQRTASYYRKEIAATIKNFLSLLEPIIICIMGIFIAFLALSIMLPIFTMMKGVAGA